MRTLDIVTLSSRIVYQNRWIKVHEDKIQRRDGSEGRVACCIRLVIAVSRTIGADAISGL